MPKVDPKIRGLLRKFATGQIKGRSVVVGWVEGNDPPRGANQLSPSIATIAAINHYGTDTIPPRPALSYALSPSRPEIRNMVERVSKLVLQGKLTQEQALKLLGEYGVSEVKKTISGRIDPPNAPRTVARKGSDVPLIDEGILRSSVTYAIREGGK